MKKRKKGLLLSILGIISLVLVTVGVTYAIFSYTKEGTTENIITTDSITFLYTEINGIGNGISITNAYPISDSQGKIQTGTGKVFDFKITSDTMDSSSIPYQVTARKSNDSSDIDEAIKIYLTKVSGDTEEEVLLSSFNSLNQTDKVEESLYTEKVIYQGIVPANTSNYEQAFRLRMWIDEDTNYSTGTMNNQTFTLTVNVYSNAKVIMDGETTEYNEELLNGADPVLTSNLVPVVISSNGSVRKASLEEDWYDYETKRWANAVVLRDTATTYEDGATIEESDIESYFVWIPKYSYQLWDLGNYSNLTAIESKEHTIKVKFGLTNTDDSVTGECTTPGVAGESGNCVVGDYMTHPAFLAFDTNGIWVGKFETGYDGATTTAEAHTDVNKVDTSKMIIKPNVYSWRNITVANMYENSYQYLRDEESHMMKNTEWGAVAYLSHSEYGINDEVRINNNSSYITGYSATVAPTIGYNNGVSVEGNRVDSTTLNTDGTYTVNYLNNSSVISSTTGNYTGIYDMSGGAWEYVMGYTTGASTVGGSSEITTLYEDFYTNSDYEKFYDKYVSTSYIGYTNRILGDGTGEMGPFLSQLDPDKNTRVKSSWYKDYAHFVASNHPWFYRGGSWDRGSNAGAFAFHHFTGSTYSFISFRVVLAP